MKYAGQTFTLYASEPVAIQGSDSLYTYQNTGTGTATIQGSNNGKDWVTITTVTSGAVYSGSHSYAFLQMTGSTEVSVSRGNAGSGTPALASGSATATNQTTLQGAQGTGASYDPPTGGTGMFGWLSGIFKASIDLLAKFSATSNSDANRLPVSQMDGGALAGSVTSATTLFTTSMVGYESLTVQVTSAGTSCTITYETSDDNTTWTTCAGLLAQNTGTFSVTSTSTAIQMAQFARKAMYFRARVSTYGSGTVSAVGTLSKAPVVQLGLVNVIGQNAEGASVGTTPVAVALESRTSSKTSVANGAVVRPIATQDGRLITRLNAIPENEWQYAAASSGIVNTADNVLQAAAGASIKNYLTGLSLANASATATEVVIKDGASTVIWRIHLAANAPIQSIKFVTPLQSTANTALNVACITTGTQTYINAQGYKAP